MNGSRKPLKRIGILTGGGDAPGLNAVIRAVVKAAASSECEVIGLEDSFDGLIESNRWRRLTPADVTGILRIGGTILGTANRGNPFAVPIQTSSGTRDYSDRCVEIFHELLCGLSTEDLNAVLEQRAAPDGHHHDRVSEQA